MGGINSYKTVSDWRKGKRLAFWDLGRKFTQVGENFDTIIFYISFRIDSKMAHLT